MNKEEIVSLFKLPEFVELLKVMGKNRDIESLMFREIAYSGDVYEIVKYNDSLILKEQGTNLGAKISFKFDEEKNDVDYYFNYATDNCTINITLLDKDGSTITFSSRLIANDTDNTFKSITPVDIMNGVITYTDSNKKVHEFNWNKLAPKNMIFEDDRIKFLNAEFALDGSKILTLNGKDVSSTDYVDGKKVRTYNEVLNGIEAKLKIREQLINKLTDFKLDKNSLSLLSDIIEEEVDYVKKDSLPVIEKVKAKRLGE